MDSQETAERRNRNEAAAVPQVNNAIHGDDRLIREMRAMIGQPWTYEMQTRIERRLDQWERDNTALLRENNRLRRGA